MISFPNAKINIGLNIVSKRPDGFHDIESVFYPIPLFDVLEFVISKDLKNNALINTGTQIDSDVNKNLCIKAYKLLQEKYNLPNVKIILHKAIPFGAGLGGGSSNAAFIIQMVNETFDLKLSNSDMMKYSSSLGSDCSFFIWNQPALATGRGEVLNFINLNLKGWYLVLVKPELNISTAFAYAGVVPKLPEVKLENSIQYPVENWKECIYNDFEKHLFIEFPDLMLIKNKLYNAGASYASMSGSGSTIYGLFKSEVDIKDNFPGCFVFGKYLE
jgi:4-diphosphocytidyl-2-C-methyl-D-erythritol kinase